MRLMDFKDTELPTSMLAARSLRDPGEPLTPGPQRFRQVSKSTWLAYEVAQEDAAKKADALNVVYQKTWCFGDIPETSFHDSSKHRVRIRRRPQNGTFDVLVMERLPEKE
jgi:hypothetical protein